MFTILEHPTAQSLLDATEVAPDDLSPFVQRMTAVVQRYLPLFARDEQRCPAQPLLQGKVTGMQRKTTEPIASQAGLKRRPLQHFLGAGLRDDRAVRSELRRHDQDDIADPKGVLILDGHAVPNHRERVLRLAVLWRKCCFGCHSETGCRFEERLQPFQGERFLL